MNEMGRSDKILLSMLSQFSRLIFLLHFYQFFKIRTSETPGGNSMGLKSLRKFTYSSSGSGPTNSSDLYASAEDSPRSPKIVYTTPPQSGNSVCSKLNDSDNSSNVTTPSSGYFDTRSSQYSGFEMHSPRKSPNAAKQFVFDAVSPRRESLGKWIHGAHQSFTRWKESVSSRIETRGRKNSFHGLSRNVYFSLLVSLFHVVVVVLVVDVNTKNHFLCMHTHTQTHSRTIPSFIIIQSRFWVNVIAELMLNTLRILHFVKLKRQALNDGPRTKRKQKKNTWLTILLLFPFIFCTSFFPVFSLF